MKRSIIIVLTFLLSLSLIACGGGKIDTSDPNQGLWIAASGEMMGISMEADALFAEGFTIELQSDGKCSINVEGEKANGTWTLNGSSITVKGGGLDCSGTLKDGALTLENMLDMGMTVVFTKDGKPPAAQAAQEEEAVEETPAAPVSVPADAGYYVIESYTMGADTLDAATLQALDMNFYIVLNEDGTMLFQTDSAITGTWEPGILHYAEDGEDAYSEYTLNGDLLTIELGSADVTLVFKRSSGAPPVSSVSDPSSWNELQRQWNGTWYGFMMFNSGTGVYEDAFDDWDMYMIVDVDAEGSGTFIVYDFELEEWARGTCTAEAEVLKVIEGSLTYSSTPMVPLDWTFYKVQDSENKIVNTTDFIGDDGDMFNNSLFFKPWGADWQDEVDSGRRGTYPPGYEDYIAMVNAGEPSPLDGGSAIDQPATNGGTPSGGELSGPLGSWSQNGVTVSFPSDTYEIQQDIIGNDFIARKDGSVQITLTVDTLQSDVKANEEYHDSYSDNEDYTTENITIGGFSARRTTYSDDWATQLYNSMVSMDFGASDSPAGITIQIGSDESIAATWTPEIQAILNTIVRD